MQKGSSTLEILIAFVVLSLCMTAVVLVGFSNQSITIDAQTNSEGVYRAQTLMEAARAAARLDFATVTATSSVSTSTIAFTQALAIEDISQCEKIATSTVSWPASKLRVQTIEFSTILTDVRSALALGGDCVLGGPMSNWDNPQRFASDTISPGKPTAIDVLNALVYLGSDKDPYLNIADTKGAVLGQNSGLFLTYTNSFSLGTTTNAVDATVWTDPLTGVKKKYLYSAMNSKTGQLVVVDVTDPYAPTIVATRSLAGVTSSGTSPQGYRLTYFKNRLYIVTRFTAGPEFHTFNVTDPTNPIELGSGIELGITVNGMAFNERFIGGVWKKLMYLATDQVSGELKVYDVTDSGSTGAISEIVADRQDLPGAQNGLSVALSGVKVYVGRQSAPSGADLYVFDATNPLTGLTQLGSQDIGTGVTGIRVVGRFAFISTPKTNKEFQVWNISNPSAISLIAEYNFGNVIDQGVEYEPDFVYATGQSTPNLQILYSP